MPDSTGFDYDGYLLFHEFCRTNRQPGTSLPGSIQSAEDELFPAHFGEFEAGNSQSPGDGYEVLDILGYIDDEETELPVGTEEFMRGSISFRRRKEDYNNEIAEVEPSSPRQQVKIPDEKGTDIFWDYDDFLMVRGAESRAKDTFSKVQSRLDNIGVKAQSETLSSGFLIWLFRKIYEGEEITPKLHSEKLSDVGVEGSEDVLGRYTQVQESQDARYSPAILLGLLHGKKISQMEGDFVLKPSGADTDSDDEKTLCMSIEPDRIHVKVSKAGLNNATKPEKTAYAVQAVRELLSAYDYWDNLEDSDQGVPPTFTAKMVDKCHEADIDVRFNEIVQNMRRQAQNQGKNLDDYDIEDHLPESYSASEE